MIKVLTQVLFWLRRRSFFRVVRSTLIMLMPVATIGAYFKLIRDCIFSPDSLIYNLLNFDSIMSDSVWNLGNVVTYSMVKVAYGLFGIYAAYFAGFYTAKLYRKDATISGICSMMIVIFGASMTIMHNAAFINAASVELSLNTRFLNINGVLISIIIGYAVGQVFHWLGKENRHVKIEQTEEMQKRVMQSFKPGAVAIGLGLIFGLLLYFFKVDLLDSSALKNLIMQYRSTNDVLTIVALTIFSSLSWWCGIGYPLDTLLKTNNSGASAVNLNYALSHGSAMNVPYKYLGSSLSQGYGFMGGAVIALTLTVVILLYSQDKQNNTVAKANIIPAMFGIKGGLAVGLPIILNPIYLLPTILIPAFNEIMAALAISLHLVVPTVYPVMSGTPGILIPFLGSNGNWSSLLFTVLLLLIDIVIFVPFILIGHKINEEMKNYDEAQAQLEKS